MRTKCNKREIKYKKWMRQKISHFWSKKGDLKHEEEEMRREEKEEEEEEEEMFGTC